MLTVFFSGTREGHTSGQKREPTLPQSSTFAIVTRKAATRILQLLEVASQPEDLNIAGFHFYGLLGKPK